MSAVIVRDERGRVVGISVRSTRPLGADPGPVRPVAAPVPVDDRHPYLALLDELGLALTYEHGRAAA